MWLAQSLASSASSWNLAERVIFPAPSPSYTDRSFPEELIFIPRPDGAKVPCLFLPLRHSRFLVLYFHPNAEDLGVCHSFCGLMRDLFQVHVLAVEYPGYGICPGKTDEAGILANAEAAFNFVTETLQWPLDGIKIFGRSLGTGPAISLASRYDVSGLILVSPFTSIRDIFKDQVGMLANALTERFDNLSMAANIVSPTLIIHGKKDSLVPVSHGKRIYDVISAKKMLVSPTGMSHNTSLLAHVGTFVLPMTHFFSVPDYTFEDIVLPPWVYPVFDIGSEPTRTPRPRGHPVAQATDALTSPPAFPDSSVADEVPSPVATAVDSCDDGRGDGGWVGRLARGEADLPLQPPLSEPSEELTRFLSASDMLSASGRDDVMLCAASRPPPSTCPQRLSSEEAANIVVPRGPVAPFGRSVLSTVSPAEYVRRVADVADVEPPVLDFGLEDKTSLTSVDDPFIADQSTKDGSEADIGLPCTL
eukprot:TRINITY_DN102542_c0_g1_i1.p1 TRINITY_DN102542_c0_g1~~TRINITY_DN102542_c0_g1_i1.p1  ORF type:complete len:476 (-),score=87.27 TRINITY_DN102542_c0_g1_i1:37-1464(-)